MTTPNYYDLHAKSVRILWYPNGKGGPIVKGHPAQALLEYSDGSQDISDRR
jgi:hypothetical protein